MTAKLASISVAMMLVAHVAGAEPNRTTTELAAAQALFDEGRTLLDEGHIDEACEKLGRSHRLDPAGGTLLNLALCHEKQGRLATAWTEYNEGLALARRDHHDVRISFAEEHLAALQGRLPRVRIHMRGAANDVSVRIDDVLLDRAALGVAIPLDPGHHVLHVTAPGKIAWRRDLTARSGETSDVDVPELAAAPVVVEPAPRTVIKGRRAAGWITAGVGTASLVNGIAFGIMALARDAKARELCPTDPCTDSDGARASDDAVKFAWISNGTLAAGLIGIGIGTYLVLTSTTTAAATPAATKPAAGFTLHASGVSFSF